MRVIAGTARGTRLGKVPARTRPLSDRAREGVFASLGALVRDARCVDLFAGTGALGIEALSRGAASCVFVDSSAAAARTIGENLWKTDLGEGARVVRSDVRRFLERPTGPYDLAFLDPPYRLPGGALRQVMERLRPRLSSGAMVALTRPSGAHTDVIPVDWRVVRRLVYGDTGVLLCREEA
jgi:16S rRNA (guanine966-N2)-methyltransferase